MCHQVSHGLPCRATRISDESSTALTGLKVRTHSTWQPNSPKIDPIMRGAALEATGVRPGQGILAGSDQPPRICLMRPSNDLSRSLLTLACDATVIAVVELSQKTWLIGAIVPGINRHPEKKIYSDEQ